MPKTKGCYANFQKEVFKKAVSSELEEGLSTEENENVPLRLSGAARI